MLFVCTDFPQVMGFSNIYIYTLSCLNVSRVTKVTEGCHIELRLIVVAILEEDVKTELKCVTQNQAGRQEVVAQLHLEGKLCTVLFCTVYKYSAVYHLPSSPSLQTPHSHGWWSLQWL